MSNTKFKLEIAINSLRDDNVIFSFGLDYLPNLKVGDCIGELNISEAYSVPDDTPIEDDDPLSYNNFLIRNKTEYTTQSFRTILKEKCSIDSRLSVIARVIDIAHFINAEQESPGSTYQKNHIVRFLIQIEYL